MIKVYVIFGIIVCAGMAYANHTGWVLWDSASSGSFRHHSGAGGYGYGGGFHAK